MKCFSLSIIAVTALSIPFLYGEEKPTLNKATFLVTGLHCPPCTKTIERSLKGRKGIGSIRVDWKTKNAKLSVDESVLGAQQLAHAIAETPHMMGGDMHYEAWLALKVEGVKEAKAAEQTKQALLKLKGVKDVVIYPDRQAAGVRFSAEGTLTSEDVIKALADAGLKATNY